MAMPHLDQHRSEQQAAVPKDAGEGPDEKSHQDRQELPPASIAVFRVGFCSVVVIGFRTISMLPQPG
jgi:hypothetical protein